MACSDIDWTPLRLLMVPLMLLCGAAIFAAVFVAGGLPVHRAGRLRGANSFTYGGTTLLQYPPTVFAKDLVRGVTCSSSPS